MQNSYFDYITFYENNKKRSFLFAKSYTHDVLAAEDIVSESFIKIWEIKKSKDLIEPEKLLYTIIKNKCLDYLKHEKVKREAFSQLNANSTRELEIRISTLEACDPDKIFAKDVQKIISKTLEELPLQTRAIFEKCRLEGLDKKTVAEMFDITIKGVDYHLSKANASFKIKLADYLSIVLFLVSFF